ncbi:hypothetical protein GCM10009722_22830 [Williamsia deligens]
MAVDARNRCGAGDRTRGASNAHPSTAPMTVFVANSPSETAASPDGPAIGVHASAYIPTARTPMGTRRDDHRRRRPSVSEAATSASAVPATNHGRYPGNHRVAETPSARGSRVATNAQPRLTTATPTITGIRRWARGPRSRPIAQASSGSTA